MTITQPTKRLQRSPASILARTVFYVYQARCRPYPCGQVADSTPGSRKGSSQSLHCDRNQRQRCLGG